MAICGAILAGGKSRRFGSDKAEAELDGKRLIDCVIEALGAQVDELVICGREEPGQQCLKDRPAPDLGPLGGLNAALHYAYERGHRYVLSAGCDVPDLPADLYRQLLGDGAAVVEKQPVIGVWPSNLAVPLHGFVLAGGRSLYDFAEFIEARMVVLYEPVANINRPEDLGRLR